ncbi:hypothetical protein ABEB36_013144 [Hypothenemus hampei]|uniref:Selenoprotein T n=1 Tax=Hypothenemus hampei TaxID=57062 RepID=A0ABD1E792_HYPHA
MAINYKSTSILVAFATCLILLFVYVDKSAAEEDLDVPVSKISQNIGAPTLKFLYCYSCGYRKMFDQYVQLINEKYPFILVDGANYNPPGIYLFLVRILGTIKFIAILAILAGIDVFAYLNRQAPSWWRWCRENKIYACMMIFFLSNMIEGQLISSGAFEITLNDVPIWSKLESGRIPQPAELFQIIDSHMQFTDSKLELNGFAK